MATIDYVSDWPARLQSRLYMQFRDLVTWEQWVQLLGAQFQELEDSAQTLLTMLDIDASQGVQLDVIGRIIGQARLGLADAIYRLYLHARILANNSTGTVEDIYKVMRALFGQDAVPTYRGGRIKQFAIRIGKVIDPPSAVAGVAFLGDAKEAGARGIFKWQESATSLLFKLDTGPGLDSGVFIGAAVAS